MDNLVKPAASEPPALYTYPVVGAPVQVQDLGPMEIAAGQITSVTPGKDPDNPQVVVVVTRTYIFQGPGVPGDPTWWFLPPA